MKRYIFSAQRDSRIDKLTPEEFANSYGYDLQDDECIEIVFLGEDPDYIKYIYMKQT